MKRVERSLDSLKYTIDCRHSPVLEVEQDETFVMETEDAPSGTYRKPEDAAHLLDAWYLSYSPSMTNPVTGPVYIRGAEPGILSLSRSKSSNWMLRAPLTGVLDTDRWATLRDGRI